MPIDEKNPEKANKKDDFQKETPETSNNFLFGGKSFTPSHKAAIDAQKAEHIAKKRKKNNPQPNGSPNQSDV